MMRDRRAAVRKTGASGRDACPAAGPGAGLAACSAARRVACFAALAAAADSGATRVPWRSAMT